MGNLKYLTTFNVVLLLLVFLQNHTVQSLPAECQLTGENLVCDGLSSFPSPFVSNAAIVEIRNSNLDEISSGAFKDLTNVDTINIHDVHIGTIKQCAFSLSYTIKDLSINNGDIGTIESYAFSDVTGSGSMALYNVIIEDVHHYAFNNISGFNDFEMHDMNITNIQSYAFNKMQVTTKFSLYNANINTIGEGAFQNINPAVNITLCQVYNLGCHTFDQLHSDLATNFHLKTMLFNCDCKLDWFVKVLKDSSTFSPSQVFCYAPEDLKDSVITDLTEQQLCSGSTPNTCDAQGVTPPDVPDTCNDVSTSSTTNVLLLMLCLFIGKLELF